MFRFFIGQAVLCAAAGLVSTICAQSSGSSSEALPTVVVEAKKTESPSLTTPSIEAVKETFSRIPGGVSVVDAEDFKRGRATTLKDALDFAPGVFVQPRFGAEEARISIRGSGIQRTFHGRGIKLLQDGSPLNLADGGFDMQSVEPLASQYVEVYRGANALQFGATTLGGAINFVSHTGHTASPFQARFEAGSFDTIRAQISSGFVEGPLDAYVSVTHSSTNGFRDYSAQSNQRLFANLGYQLSDNVETRFYVTYLQTDSELPGNLTKAQMEANPQMSQPGNQANGWKRDFKLFRIANRTTITDGLDQTLTLSTFWSWKDLDHPITPFAGVIDQLSNDLGIDIRYDNTGDFLGHENRFTLGYSMVYGVAEDNRFLNVLGQRGAKVLDVKQQSMNLDLYAQNTFSLTNDLSLITGGQVSFANRDFNEEGFFGGATPPPLSLLPNLVDNTDRQEFWGFSPKLGLLWDVDDKTQVFFNASRSFEPPSFGELVNPPVAGSIGLIPLDPQTATTLELGSRGERDRVRWDVSYYYSWVENELLQYTLLPFVTRTVNAGRTIHQGIEAAVDVDLLAGVVADGDRLTLRQNYLWNDFRFDNDATFGNNRLPGIPEHYYRAELLYDHPSGFYCGPNVEWVPSAYAVDSAESLFVDPYALLGFKIGFKSKKGFSVFLDARNLTDETYAATTGVSDRATPASALFLPGDGRSFFAGIEWKW